MRQIHSSDYDDEDDGEYEEVGSDDYEDNDEDGDVIIPITNGQRRSSIILAPPMNELKENEHEGESDDEGDDEFFREARDIKELDFLNDEPEDDYEETFEEEEYSACDEADDPSQL